jgi:undecaprenyl diphosphate synthase
MISDEEMKRAPEKMYKVVEWCLDISSEFVRHHPEEKGIASITFHISTRQPDPEPGYLPAIKKIASKALLILHYGNTYETVGKGIPVAVAVGKSGRDEIVDVIKKMAEQSIPPEEIDEHAIEKFLTFQHTPDYVIKTGGSHLVDFLIWQSVYSELFFLDLNWEDLRKVDILRSFRDYQSRKRRFGV